MQRAVSQFSAFLRQRQLVNRAQSIGPSAKKRSCSGIERILYTMSDMSISSMTSGIAADECGTFSTSAGAAENSGVALRLNRNGERTMTRSEENNSVARGSENRFRYFASLTCSLFSSYTPNFLATGFRVG